MIVGVADAAAALGAGDVVAVPTDTVYGLAADPRLPRATEGIFALKDRPASVALPVLVADLDAGETLASFDDGARRLASRFWPGALTLVLRRLAPSEEFDLGGDRATIGLRCPGSDLVLELLRAAGPLAVTSANLHGGDPCRSAGEVAAVFGPSLLVVDGGVCDGEPSTVVELTGGPFRCLREGALPAATVAEWLQPTTGRTPPGPESKGRPS